MGLDYRLGWPNLLLEIQNTISCCHDLLACFIYLMHGIFYYFIIYILLLLERKWKD